MRTLLVVLAGAALGFLTGVVVAEIVGVAGVASGSSARDLAWGALPGVDLRDRRRRDGSRHRGPASALSANADRRPAAPRTWHPLDLGTQALGGGCGH